MGAVEPERINELTRNCPLYSKYGQAIDRESAYETLQKQKKQANAPVQKQPANSPNATKATQTSKPKTSAKSKSLVNKAASSAMNTVGREVGKALIRGLLGSMKK